MSNDNPVIPVTAVAPADGDDPVYQALLKEIERGGTVLQDLGAIAEKPEVEGPWERDPRTVVARVLVDFVVEPSEEGELLDMIVYPAVATDRVKDLSIPAAVHLAYGTLGHWLDEEGIDRGAAPQATGVAIEPF